jgi:hypothetical protein
MYYLNQKKIHLQALAVSTHKRFIAHLANVDTIILLAESKLQSSVADPGCLSRIPDPTFFHPGSRIRTVSIPDPGSSSKNLCILTPKKAKKLVSKL